MSAWIISEITTIWKYSRKFEIWGEKGMPTKELEPIKIMQNGESLEFSEGIIGISLNGSIEKVCEDDIGGLTRRISNGFEIKFDLLDAKKNIFRIFIFGTNNWRKLHGLSMIRRKVWKEKLNLKHQKN